MVRSEHPSFSKISYNLSLSTPKIKFYGLCQAKVKLDYHNGDFCDQRLIELQKKSKCWGALKKLVNLNFANSFFSLTFFLQQIERHCCTPNYMCLVSFFEESRVMQATSALHFSLLTSSSCMSKAVTVLRMACSFSFPQISVWSVWKTGSQTSFSPA